MDKLVVTGYTSEIAKSFFQLLEVKQEISVIKCGRGEDADLTVDFSSPPSTKKFIEKLDGIEPRYLFLNHGVLPGKSLLESSEEEITNSVQVNMISTIMILETLKQFKDLKTVVMSSISGKAGSYDTLYASCKAGVDLIIKKCAVSLPPSSRLNSVSPGIIFDARMTKIRTDVKNLKTKENQTPTKKLTSSAEVANLVYYLLFESDNIQGENININGGLFVK